MTRRGFRFVADVQEDPDTGRTPAIQLSSVDTSGLQQSVRFCQTADGVHLAVATADRGTPLVKCRSRRLQVRPRNRSRCVTSDGSRTRPWPSTLRPAPCTTPKTWAMDPCSTDTCLRPAAAAGRLGVEHRRISDAEGRGSARYALGTKPRARQSTRLTISISCSRYARVAMLRCAAGRNRPARRVAQTIAAIDTTAAWMPTPSSSTACVARNCAARSTSRSIVDAALAC